MEHFRTVLGGTGSVTVRAGLIITRFLNAVTTGAFFAIYVPGLWNWLLPEVGWILSAVTGMFIFDGMSYVWQIARERDSTSLPQFKLAKGAVDFDMIASAVITGLFVVLSSAFDLGSLNIYNQAGGLTTFGLIINISGASVATLGLIYNMVVAVLYRDAAAEVTARINATEMSGIQITTDQEIRKAHALAKAERTYAGITSRIPQLAAGDAEVATSQYIRDWMTRIDSDGDGKISAAELLQVLRARQQLEPTYTGGGEQPGATDPEAPLEWQRQQANRDRPHPPRS